MGRWSEFQEVERKSECSDDKDTDVAWSGYCFDHDTRELGGNERMAGRVVGTEGRKGLFRRRNH